MQETAQQAGAVGMEIDGGDGGGGVAIRDGQRFAAGGGAAIEDASGIFRSADEGGDKL
jgi:hypothetical protein